MRLVIPLILLLVASASAQEERSWHFLSQTYGGQISLLRDLTKHECDFLYARAYHNPATEEEKRGAEIMAQRRREENEKYRAEHPECTATKDNLFPPISCAIQNNVASYMITSGDTKSAECFQ